jgi:putative ABC transport system permease protein
MSLVVAAREQPESLAGSIRGAIRDVDANLAIFSIRTMTGVIADSLSDFTLLLLLMATFAALAVVLAATGTFGVIACLASSRAREFAIRVALGPDGRRVARLVLGHGVRITVLGLVVGFVAVVWIAPLLRMLPVTVRPPDLFTVVPVALLIGAVAVGASLIPAWRASRANRVTALKAV